MGLGPVRDDNQGTSGREDPWALALRCAQWSIDDRGFRALARWRWDMSVCLIKSVSQFVVAVVSCIDGAEWVMGE